MKNSAVAWSFGKETSRSRFDNIKNPGPGQYAVLDVTNNKMKSPHWKLGTAKRSNSQKQFVFGPRNYEIKGRLGEAPTQ